MSLQNFGILNLLFETYSFVAHFVVSNCELACTQGYTNSYNCGGHAPLAFRNDYICCHLPKKTFKMMSG